MCVGHYQDECNLSLSGVECTRSNDDSLACDVQKTASVVRGVVGGSKLFCKTVVTGILGSLETAGGLKRLETLRREAGPRKILT